MISDIEIQPCPYEAIPVLAEVAVKIDGVLLVQSIRVVEGAKGLFVSWPYYKDGSANRVPVVHVDDKRKRWEYDNRIISAYLETVR